MYGGFDKPVADARLGHGEVHVWLVWLDAVGAGLTALLAADERQRAARFRFERDRQRFIARWGVLRLLVGTYLGLAPRAVVFAREENGKPYVDGMPEASGLCFNLSHSEGIAAYAFCRGRQTGIDIEKVRDGIPMTQLVERFFSPAERAVWRGLREEQRREAFFNCWTRKEAFIKALGMGLAYPLDRFEVTFAPGKPARLLALDGDREAACAWSLYSWDLAGYKLALAVKGRPGVYSGWWGSGAGLSAASKAG